MVGFPVNLQELWEGGSPAACPVSPSKHSPDAQHTACCCDHWCLGEGCIVPGFSDESLFWGCGPTVPTLSHFVGV